MERYSEYKDSGVKWLGEIPSHWELLKSKYLWKETFENSTSGKEDLLSVSQYTGVTKSKADSRSESLIGYKIVHKDDLVINIMLAWLGGLGVSNDEGIVSPAYCTYKLIRDYNPKFLHYLYKTPMYLAEFARHSTGVVPSRWRMYTDDFGQVISLLPPVEEQDAIVRYLDAATSKIDKAIAMQQKMIDLLNERKQIIIQNAVTKGLDENVEMKDSGVEWIGMIPKHWEKIRLKNVFCKRLAGSWGNEQNISQRNTVCLRIADFDYKKLKFKKGKEYTLRSYPLKEIEMKKLAKGDLLIEKSGGGEKTPVGRCIVYDLDFRDAMYANFMEKLSIRDISDSYYICYLLSCFYSQGMIWPYIKATTGIQNLDIASLLSKEYIFIPSKSEQQAIAAHLDKEMQHFDSAISNCQRQISLLQERKQIIINEVVTGKVKVS